MRHSSSFAKLLAVSLLCGIVPSYSFANEITEVASIYWHDADSGRINGSVKFRLNSVDAPETGGVGAAIGGAECEKERRFGFESKGWVVEKTKGAKLTISKHYGLDKYERLIVDISVNDRDL